MNSHTVAQLTHMLSEEAQMITEELKNNGHYVHPDMIVAKLDGLVTRMKYELRNKGPDLSSHEFPIFNVSQDSSIVYPEPVNYLYDKHYNEAFYSSAQSTQPKALVLEQKAKPILAKHSNSSSVYPVYPSNQTDWYTVEPQVTHHETPKIILDELSVIPTHRVRRSFTLNNSDSQPTPRIITRRELHDLANSTSQKIVVNVINDKPSSTKHSKSQKKSEPPTRTKSQKSILKSNNPDKNKENIIKRKVHKTPSTVIDVENIKYIDEVVKNLKSVPSQSKPKPEHITIIEPHDSKSSNKKSNKPKKERLRSSKSRTSKSVTTSMVPITPLSRYTIEPPTYYEAQHVPYQQPKAYTTPARNNYSITPYVANANNFYQFVYYQY